MNIRTISSESSLNDVSLSENMNTYLPTVYCEICDNNVEYTIYEEQNISEKIDNEIVAFIGKIAKCKTCNHEVFPEEIFKENKERANREYRKIKNIILIEEIKQILNKYNIGATVLSEILGWGRITITRYERGRTPSKKYSDILYDLLKNPTTMRELVLKNKNKMTPIAYNKTIESIDNEISKSETCASLYEDKINIVANYVLRNEVTNKALQKILYLIQGFSLAFDNEPIFFELPEAWVHGPVYRCLYNKFKNNGCNPIIVTMCNDNNKLLLNEIKLIDNVMKYFGCFTANKLEAISHNEMPWIKARGGLREDENSTTPITLEDMREYFSGVKNKYNLINYSDIKEYAKIMVEQT